MDKRILENVRECRRNYKEYISSRYNILEKIKSVTDEKNWTDTVYTDGFLVILQKTGDWIKIEDFFDYQEKIQRNITFEDFLRLAQLTRNYVDVDEYLRMDYIEEEGNIIDSSKINEEVQKFV